MPPDAPQPQKREKKAAPKSSVNPWIIGTFIFFLVGVSVMRDVSLAFATPSCLSRQGAVFQIISNVISRT